MRRNWSQMRPPYSSTHFHTSPRKLSRPTQRPRAKREVMSEGMGENGLEDAALLDP